MTKAAFIEQIFDPIVQKQIDELCTDIDKGKDAITATFIKSLDLICNELPEITLPNAKYITFSLIRTHLIETGEFSYCTRMFDDEFKHSTEFSAVCFYEASWLTDRLNTLTDDVEQQVSKSMIKHDPVFIKELMAQVVDVFNIYFVNTIKDSLVGYYNDTLHGLCILAGDYMFSSTCLVQAKYEKIKTFNTEINEA